MRRAGEERGGGPPGHEDAFLDLCALAAAGAISPEDRAALEAHLALGCTSCAEALRGFADAAAALAGTLPRLALPAGGRDRLLAAVSGGARLLVTECLQEDFLRPLGPGEAPETRIHPGRAAALRLMAELPAVLGAFAAAQRRSGRHAAVHVRDFHLPGNEKDAEHFAAFGPHAIAGTPGVELVEAVREALDAPGTRVIELEPLFVEEGTLARAAAAALGRPPGEGARAAVVGPAAEYVVRPLGDMLRAAGFRVAVAEALVASGDAAAVAATLERMRAEGFEVVATAGELLAWLEA